MKESVLELHNTQTTVNRVEMNLIGKDLGFVDSIMFRDNHGNEFLGINDSESKLNIYMILSDIGCDLCANESADIINNLISHIDQEISFNIIIESDNLLFSDRFKKYYQLNIPIYSDYNLEISSMLNLQNYPIILIVDNNRKVYYAYYPNPALDYRNHLFEDIIARVSM